MPKKTNKHKNKIDQLDYEIILSLVLGKSREYLLAHPEIQPSFFQKIKFNRLTKKREKGLPLAYITGHKEFFGLDFFVNKYTLIPRPDTELIVELAIEKIKEQTALIDVGTGTGCIPIALIKHLNHTYRQAGTLALNHLYVFATDISKSALKIAKKNTQKHGVDITFLHGNLLEPLSKHLSTLAPKHLIITANLPYLTQAQFESEPSIQHEPHSALVANNGGLSLYEELLQQIKQLVTSHKLTAISCLFEIDPSQTEKIFFLIKKYSPESLIEIKKDLCGLDRVATFNFI